jgi:hypothetical protein
MNRLKYSLLVLIGACSYGILSTIMKFAYAEGFHINEVIGSQYFFLDGYCFSFYYSLAPAIGLQKSRRYLYCSQVLQQA